MMFRSIRLIYGPSWIKFHIRDYSIRYNIDYALDWIRNHKPEGIRRTFANKMVNRYIVERIMLLGPDIACLEWLMNAGSTCVTMSNGFKITTQLEMRKFVAEQGVDLNSIPKVPIPPDVNIVKDFNSSRSLKPSIDNDFYYEKRWPHVSPIYIKEVDATDAALTDQGFRYFTECRHLERLKMNHTDYLGNQAIRELALGRPVKTLLDLEIVYNSRISDESTFWLCRLKALRRLHLYFLPLVSRRSAMLRQLRLGLPNCVVSFPESYYLGYGYEEEKSSKEELIKQQVDQRRRRI